MERAPRALLLIALQLNWGVDMTGLVSSFNVYASSFPCRVIVGRRGPEAASTVDPADIRRLPVRTGSAARSGCVGSWLILDSGIPVLRPARTA